MKNFVCASGLLVLTLSTLGLDTGVAKATEDASHSENHQESAEPGDPGSAIGGEEYRIGGLWFPRFGRQSDYAAILILFSLLNFNSNSMGLTYSMAECRR